MFCSWIFFTCCKLYDTLRQARSIKPTLVCFFSHFIGVFFNSNSFVHGFINYCTVYVTLTDYGIKNNPYHITTTCFLSSYLHHQQSLGQVHCKLQISHNLQKVAKALHCCVLTFFLLGGIRLHTILYTCVDRRAVICKSYCKCYTIVSTNVVGEN